MAKLFSSAPAMRNFTSMLRSIFKTKRGVALAPTATKPIIRRPVVAVTTHTPERNTESTNAKREPDEFNMDSPKFPSRLNRLTKEDRAAMDRTWEVFLGASSSSTKKSGRICDVY
eukprot:c55807_g1_i1.p1 GENE.c55807_g1_i1~~c55807_g1_i1.p1  ORF type:complete len:115 (-),score=11.08 c55807_g1_i1:79-423(-)